MKKIFPIAIALTTAIVLFSCGESKYKAEIKTIDSLKTVVDSIQKILSEVDTMQIEKDYKSYQQNISLLKKYFNDKKEDSTWKLMTNYGALRPALKTFVREYSGYYSDIKFSRNQLDSLKTDIESGNLTKEKIREYTKTESEAVTILKATIETSVNGVKSRLRLLDSLNPKVEQLIEKLRNEGKIGKDAESGEEEEDD